MNGKVYIDIQGRIHVHDIKNKLSESILAVYTYSTVVAFPLRMATAVRYEFYHQE